MGGFGPAGGGLPQQDAVHAGAQAGVQLAPQGKAERFAVKRNRGFFQDSNLEEFCHLENLTTSLFMKRNKVQ